MLEVKGRPSWANINRAIMDKIAPLNQPHQNNFPIHQSYFLPNTMLTDLMCLNCELIATQPFEVTTCQHYLCAQCIIDCYEASGVLSCSCGSGTIVAEQLRLPPPVVLNC